MIEAVAALDFRLADGAFDYAQRHTDEIAAHWAKRHAEQPSLFNGRVLMLGRHAVEGGVLSGEFVETDFSAFLAWREAGCPAASACNGFAMAALRGADGAFLLGEMGPHTASAGAIYFPAGTPDRHDVFGDVVDLDASARRELVEETGLNAGEAEIAPGWIIVRAPGRVACMKPMRLAETAEAAKARIDPWLAADPQAELAKMHVVRSPADFSAAMPPFVRAFMAWVWEGERRG